MKFHLIQPGMIGRQHEIKQGMAGQNHELYQRYLEEIRGYVRLADVGTEAVGSSPMVLDIDSRAQFAFYRKLVKDNPALLGGL